jgi:hypothetical protein
MTISAKVFAAIIASFVLVAGVTAPQAGACGKKHWRGADAGPVYYKHHRHWKHRT